MKHDLKKYIEYYNDYVNYAILEFNRAVEELKPHINTSILTTRGLKLKLKHLENENTRLIFLFHTPHHLYLQITKQYEDNKYSFDYNFLIANIEYGTNLFNKNILHYIPTAKLVYIHTNININTLSYDAEREKILKYRSELNETILTKKQILVPPPINAWEVS